MSVAVLNMARVLDESAPGRAGAADLKAAWLQKRDQYDRAMKRLGAGAHNPNHPGAQELAAMDTESQQELGELRNAMIKRVLDQARVHVDALCKERKIAVVLDSNTIFQLGLPEADITSDVIQRLDAGGK